MIALLRDRFDVWRYRRKWKKVYNYVDDLWWQEFNWANTDAADRYADMMREFNTIKVSFESDVEKWGL